MSITATDIQNQVFSTARHGYNPEEVDDFLERLAFEVDSFESQLIDLDNRLMNAEDHIATTDPLVQESEARLVDAEAKIAAAEQNTAEVEARLAEANARIAELEAQIASAAETPAPDPTVVLALQNEVLDLKKQLQEKTVENEVTISAAIISAQRAADSLREEARAEGEQVYRESEAKARQIVQEALGRKEQVLVEIEQLKAQRVEFYEAYHKLLETFLSKSEILFETHAPDLLPGGAEIAAAPTAQAMAQDFLRAPEAAEEEAPQQAEPVAAPVAAPVAEPVAAPEPEPAVVQEPVYSSAQLDEDDLDIEEID